MERTDIARLRLQAQHILSGTGTPAGVVAHLGAVQAQDYAMAKWAIALRTAKPDAGAVQRAVDEGSIIRTHVMRPTWHFVAAEDLRWMLELTADRIRRTMKSRAEQLGLTPDVRAKNHKILEQALKNEPLIRERIMDIYAENGLDTSEYRGGHLLAYAELDALICSGPDIDGKPTYALLDQRIKPSGRKTPDEGAALLAKRYLDSHGPATASDFSWWSGLPLTVCRKAIADSGPWREETVGGSVYFLSKDLKSSRRKSVHLLPAFDEFLIAYTDRTAALETVHNKKAISSNGIFNPVIEIDGQVRGLWKRTIKKDAVIISPDFFAPPGNTERKAVEAAAEKYARCLGKSVVMES